MNSQLQFYDLPIGALKLKFKKYQQIQNVIIKLFTIKSLELHVSTLLVLSTGTLHQYVFER